MGHVGEKVGRSRGKEGVGLGQHAACRAWPILGQLDAWTDLFTIRPYIGLKKWVLGLKPNKRMTKNKIK